MRWILWFCVDGGVAMGNEGKIRNKKIKGIWYLYIMIIKEELREWEYELKLEWNVNGDNKYRFVKKRKGNDIGVRFMGGDLWEKLYGNLDREYDIIVVILDKGREIFWIGEVNEKKYILGDK